MLFTSWLRTLKTGFVSPNLREKARRRRMWNRTNQLTTAGIESLEDRIVLSGAPVFGADPYAFSVAEDASLG
ncbi:MAG: LEPR-XLL domain-containing protein, partial [Planctomycetes bacterium]|nr:LEPR-XLL domain-containing protein [Planctomycetota bacterium]